MNSQQWLEAFRAQLQKEAVPSWHVARIVQELRDHFDDVEENSTMSEVHDAVRVMGSPFELGSAAGAEFRERSYLQRHPRLKRAALPVFATGLLVAAGLLFAGPAASFASDYELATKVRFHGGETLSAPRVATRPDQEATITLEHERVEYRMSIKSAKDPDARHSIQMRITGTDDSSDKTTTYAPRVSLSTGNEATIGIGEAKFSVKITRK